MKTKLFITLFLIAISQVVVFGQSDFLSASSYEFDMNGESSSEYTVNEEITTLEYTTANIDILQLHSVVSDELNFAVYPEANNQRIKLVSNYPVHEDVEYMIFNCDGVEICRKSISDDNTLINISGLEHGTYILHIYLHDSEYQVFRIKKKTKMTS